MPVCTYIFFIFLRLVQKRRERERERGARARASRPSEYNESLLRPARNLARNSLSQTCRRTYWRTYYRSLSRRPLIAESSAHRKFKGPNHSWTIGGTRERERDGTRRGKSERSAICGATGSSDNFPDFLAVSPQDIAPPADNKKIP